MIERILDLSKQYPEAILKKRSVPMPKSGYLYHTKEYPLVLGGPEEIRITGYTDASLATGPS